jgi:alkylated DNA repair dioxygenase AlkB
MRHTRKGIGGSNPSLSAITQRSSSPLATAACPPLLARHIQQMTAAQQDDLFRPASEPEGFRYAPGVISRAEEQRLACHIAELPLQEFLFQGFVAKRRVMSFGWRYDFERARFEQAERMPDFLLGLRARAAGFAGLEAEQLAHALVTEYAPGAQIGWHKDRPVFEDVIGVSLLSACTFRFRRRQGAKWQRHSLEAEPRSMYLLRGLSRWDWEHSIPAVDTLRYSVTFRGLRRDDVKGRR